MIESKPITFETPESYIVLPSWDVGIRGGSISFTFQTNEPNGVIMYNSGMQNSDFFAFELLDGYLNFIIDLGSGSQKVKVFPKRVNDQKPHTVLLEHGTEKRGTVYFDGQPKHYVVPGDSSHLDLDGVLYVGGINDYKNIYTLPKELWAGILKYGFVGCLLDLAVNGNKVDILTVARKQRRSGIKDNCRVMEPQCMTRPCMHRGFCNEGWNRFVCDCRMTEYVGTICQTRKLCCF
ncbi:hypothetical protein KUTeg_013824 [Tegillarca granosa]|uniref:Uncharacterized protein n=1 Tax=Tegillarca granosa TaxID=220873 RepID=A0ABQ9EYM1_TEGGR|nr:hypothetical protein KUTeg_013824 [Tegillarca granosa]